MHNTPINTVDIHRSKMFSHLRSRIIPSSLQCTAQLSSVIFSNTVLCTLPSYNEILGGVRFATKKAGGSSNNSKDSAGRRLGLKISGGARGMINLIHIDTCGVQY